MQKPSQKTTSRRIFELDLLRGFFIAVIIIDHLQFWPSGFIVFTGEGRLWVSAAEGFFLISGLLIGYIRAYKGKKHSLTTLTKLLWKRAAMLYVWGILVTVFVLGFTLAVGNHALLPKLPDAATLSSPLTLFFSIISGQYFSDWIYFLRLYAIMLLVTPLFLYLVRRGKEIVVIALIVFAYLLSFWWPESALQWQVLFFGAALIGYRLESILSFLSVRPRLKKWTMYTSISAAAATMLVSFFVTHGWILTDGVGFNVMDREQFMSLKSSLDPLFTNSPLVPGRLILAFLWFVGGLAFLHLTRQFIIRWFGWLLFVFGERSLTAYILQAFLLPIIVGVLPLTDNWLLNTLISGGVLILHWYIMRIRFIQKHLPR